MNLNCQRDRSAKMKLDQILWRIQPCVSFILPHVIETARLPSPAHTFEGKCSIHANVFGFFLSNSACESQLLNYLLKNSMCREVLTDLNFKVNQALGAVRKHSHCYVQKPQYCCFIVPSLKKGNPPFHTHVCRLFLPEH